MQGWQVAAASSACFIALHYLLLRASAGRIGDSLGALVVETAAAAGIALAYLLGIRSGTVPTERSGVVFAVLSGLAVAVGSTLLFAALRRGGPIASTGTIVLGGGVAIAAIAAPFVFNEPMTFRRIVGVGLGIAAMVVLSTEPAPPAPSIAVGSPQDLSHTSERP